MEVKKTVVNGQEIETVVLNRGHGAQDYTKVTLEKFVSTVQKTFDKGTMTEERANDALSDLFNDAVLATRDKNGPQGIFEGAPKERDEIMKLVTQSERSYRDRLKDALPHVNSLIKATRAREEELQQQIRKERGELAQMQASMHTKRTLAETLRKVAGTDFKLEANDTTRLHRLVEAFQQQRVYLVKSAKEIEKIEAPFDLTGDGVRSFVVRHDWAAVLHDSEGDKTGDVFLPAPHCAFEFRVNGVNVIVIAMEVHPMWATMIDAGDFWFMLNGNFELAQYCASQVKAACIVLDAKVATHDVTLPPPKLNAKREKSGKPLLLPFHTIDLARRKVQHTTSHAGDGTGTKKRLHFCRSHNRTYKETGKTIRIPWCLKGDPNIGIVDKLYKL